MLANLDVAVLLTPLPSEILRISGQPDTDAEPFYDMEKDHANTQVVILDEFNDGPFFSLYNVISGRPPIRMGELISKYGPPPPDDDALADWSTLTLVELIQGQRLVV